MKPRGWKMENGEWRDSDLERGGPPPRSPGSSRSDGKVSARGLAPSKTCWRFVALLVFAVLPVAPTLAQTYAIDWFTIAGGGGTGTGGVFRVTGTLGQPDAGTMRGGDYSLLGGFWGVAAVQTTGAPLLSVVQTNGTISVYWPLPAAGFVLEQTMSVPNPPPNWSQVAFPYRTNSTHISITVPLPAASKFYRLRKP